MSESAETELSPFTRRMKEHLAEALDACSQGRDGRMRVSRQMIDDLHEATIVWELYT